VSSGGGGGIAPLLGGLQPFEAGLRLADPGEEAGQLPVELVEGEEGGVQRLAADKAFVGERGITAGQLRAQA
jgi:hypothetical protein